MSRVLAVLIAIYLVAPLAIVVPTSLTGESFLHFPPSSYSLRWYASVLQDPLWRLAAVNSFRVALVAVAVSAALGVPLAFVLARARMRNGTKGLIVGAMILPALTPIIVVAVAIFVWYLDLGVVGRFWAIGLAHSLFGLPFVVLIVMAALRDFDVRVEWAARSLGAGPRLTASRVTLPLISPAVVSGVLLAFLLSLDELLIARGVSSPDTATLPIQIWNGVLLEISPALAVVSVLYLLVAIAVGSLTVGLSRRRALGKEAP